MTEENMTEKEVAPPVKKWALWKKLLCGISVLVMAFAVYPVLSPSVERLSDTVLDTELDLDDRKNYFGRLIDKLHILKMDGSLFKVLGSELTQKFEKLILDHDDDLEFRRIVTDRLLLHDSGGDMKSVIEALIKDETQPDSLRELAIHACTDQPLLTEEVISDWGESSELRLLALRNSEDKDLLRRWVVDGFDPDIQYQVAQRLCQIDQKWLTENVVLDMGADIFLRIEIITNCFEGGNEVLDQVFGNKDEEDETRVAALLVMSGYPESSFGHNDNLLMIAMDKTKPSLVRNTAFMVYGDRVGLNQLLQSIRTVDYQKYDGQ